MNRHPDELSTADLVGHPGDVQARQEERMSGRASDVPPGSTESGGPMPSSAERDAYGDHGASRTDEPSSRPALFPGDEADRLRSRWGDIQTGFVDEPRRAVEQADALVAETMKRMAEVFARERGSLEAQWDRGDQVNTEDLRVALQRYRSFFDRLLSF
jgi:hypothetical protein